MAWGVELRGNGQRIGWTPDAYLDSLEDKLRGALDKAAAASYPLRRLRQYGHARHICTPFSTTLSKLSSSSRREESDAAGPWFEEFGVVTYIGQGIARVRGLPNVKSEELVRFEGGCWV